MTAAEIVAQARRNSIVDDETLGLVANDPAILAWLDQWLPSRAAGTLAMVRGVVPVDIQARLGEVHAERFKSTLPLLIGLYTRGDHAT